MTAVARPQSSTPARTPAELEGAWRMVGLELGGSGEAPTAEVTWEVRRNELVIRHGGVVQKPPGTAVFALVTPPGGGVGAVDYVLRSAAGSGMTLHGGYKTDGQTLTLCFSLRGARPAGCESGPDLILYTFERVPDPAV